MAFLDELEACAWRDRVKLHVSEDRSRADLQVVFAHPQPRAHVYACGSDAYMSAVMQVAEAAGVPDDHRHLEYFSVPDAPEHENHEFTLKLARSGVEFTIPADRVTTDVLLEHGVSVNVKCSDGLCGVCRCGLLDGAVEHRDFVLSKSQRENNIILCQSRAAEKDGVIVIDL